MYNKTGENFDMQQNGNQREKKYSIKITLQQRFRTQKTHMQK